MQPGGVIAIRPRPHVQNYGSSKYFIPKRIPLWRRLPEPPIAAASIHESSPRFAPAPAPAQALSPNQSCICTDFCSAIPYTASGLLSNCDFLGNCVCATRIPHTPYPSIAPTHNATAIDPLALDRQPTIISNGTCSCTCPCSFSASGDCVLRGSGSKVCTED